MVKKSKVKKLIQKAMKKSKAEDTNVTVSNEGSGSTIKRRLREGFFEGVQQKAKDTVSGSGRGQASSAPAQSTAMKGISKKALWVIAIIALVSLAGCATPLRDAVTSGWFGTRVGGPLTDAAKPLKETLEYLGDQAQKIRRVTAGEQIFDWGGEARENVRSGIWFEDGFSYGTNAIFTTDQGVIKTLDDAEFGAKISIVVGKMSKYVDDVTAYASCTMEDRRGVIRYFEGEGIKLANPDPEDKRKYSHYLDCVFLGKDAENMWRKTEGGEVYFSKDIVFNLSYSLKPKVFMPVFVIPRSDLYEDYRGRSREAFENLVGGVYGDSEFVSSDGDVRSMMQFIHDVEAVMKINPFHPISPDPNRRFTFTVLFNNKDVKNTAHVKSFEFTFPEGIKIGNSASTNPEKKGSPCEYFEKIGENAYVFKDEYFDDIEKELNQGLGQTGPYPCELIVDPDLSNEEHAMLELGMGIEGVLEYEYVISEEVNLRN